MEFILKYGKNLNKSHFYKKFGLLCISPKNEDVKKVYKYFSRKYNLNNPQISGSVKKRIENMISFRSFIDENNRIFLANIFLWVIARNTSVPNRKGAVTIFDPIAGRITKIKKLEY